MTVPAIAAVTAVPLPDLVAAPLPTPPASGAVPSFASLLTNGLDDVSAKVQDADKLARAFALDDSIPLHQVTFALENARLSLEMMTQVRTRLIEGYQQLMNMQL